MKWFIFLCCVLLVQCFGVWILFLPLNNYLYLCLYICIFSIRMFFNAFCLCFLFHFGLALYNMNIMQVTVTFIDNNFSTWVQILTEIYIDSLTYWYASWTLASNLIHILAIKIDVVICCFVHCMFTFSLQLWWSNFDLVFYMLGNHGERLLLLLIRLFLAN